MEQNNDQLPMKSYLDNKLKNNFCTTWGVYLQFFALKWQLVNVSMIFVVFELYSNISDVIHTVGPIGEKPDKLRCAYTRCLQVARENNVRTVVSWLVYIVGSYLRPMHSFQQ